MLAQGSDNWRHSARHIARVILLVSSVAAVWMGFFGLVDQRGSEQQAHIRHLFISPQTAISLLFSSGALIGAQLKHGWTRALALTATLFAMIGWLLAQRTVMGEIDLLSFDTVGVILVWLGSICAWVSADTRSQSAFHWPNRSSVLLTVLGTLFSIGGAYWLIHHDFRQSQRTVDVRAQEIARAVQDSLRTSLSGFARMTERWGSLHHEPSFSFIDLEFLTYLRDLPHATAIVAFDHAFEVVHARPDGALGFDDVAYLLGQRESVKVLDEARRRGMTKLLSPRLSPDSSRVGFVVAGWGNEQSWGGIVLTSIDVSQLVEQAFHLRQVPCCLAIESDGVTIFSKTESASDPVRNEAVATFDLSGHHYQVRYWTPGFDSLSLQNPFPMVFLGLGLLFTFFVNNSQRLAHFANARAREVQYRALHDVITELPNRQMLEQCLDGHFDEHLQPSRGVSLMLLSVEGLRLVNDSIGHTMGDGLLCVIAQRLNSHVKEPSMVARIDGGHFAICVVGFDRGALDALAADLVRLVSEPVRIEPHLIRVNAVIGIATGSSNQTSASTLLRQADLAMLEARRLGRDAWCHFTDDLGTAVSERMALSADLRNALQEEQLQFHYQPVVDGWTGAIVGYEALIRWFHPQYGYITPARFIPMAEESGEIVELTHWALESAALAAQRMNQGLRHDVYVAVNISTLVFRRTDFVGQVKKVLTRHRLPARWLEIEITESMLLDDPDSAIDKLRDLGALGVRIALDDFGTGYSSLNYLKRLPIHKVKLDRSFVNDIVEDPADAAIARGVIAVADLLKLTVIVEGVETARQFAFLKRIHCQQFQGYLFAKPQPLDAVLDQLRENMGYLALPDTQSSHAVSTVLVIGAESVSHKVLEQFFYQTQFRVLQARDIPDVMTQLALNPIDVLICIEASLDQASQANVRDMFARVRHLHPDTRRVLVADAAVRESLVDALNEGEIERMIPLPLDSARLMELIRGNFRS